MKKCKICKKQFTAKGRALTCSPECSKINKTNIAIMWNLKNPEKHKKNQDAWRENNREHYNAQQREYGKSYRAKKREESLKKWDWQYIQKFMRGEK